MDRLTRYRELLRQALCSIAAELPPEASIRTELILDEVHDHYEILEVGWDGSRRIHGILIHCDIRDGKIHIEHDGTDIGVADLLLAKDVPHQDIVLGFHPPQLRKLTPFAAA
jgi:ketopantoate reductase